MPKPFGQPGEEWGDKEVFKVLSDLPDEFRIYAQPPLVHGDQRRDPDYVIVHKKAGVIVLEVKDWVTVEPDSPNYAMVRRKYGDTFEKKTSPVYQALKAAHLLSDMLKEDEDLCKYAGKLDFPYRNAGFLPHLPASDIRRLEKVWQQTHVFGRDDLDPDILAKKLLQISIPYTYSGEMTYKQVRATCAIIDKTLKVKDPVNKQFRGVYDETQEEISKEPLPVVLDLEDKEDAEQSDMFSTLGLIDPEKRINHLEREMPPDVADLKSNANIRLLRGFAGTGKTDVLVLRTNYLHKNYKDIDILVTTFNKPIIDLRLRPELIHLERVHVTNFDQLCAEIHRNKTGKLLKAQNSPGILNKIAKNNPLINKWGVDFLGEEFEWMKETGRTTRDAYINDVRDGRGGSDGMTLSQQMKSEVYDIFELYQAELEAIPAHDWADRRNFTLKFLQYGTEPSKKYDVILVDEAQHFAPNWMHILYYFLKPNGSLFICDDPSQSVYRFYSWRQKGVDVVGRTRWLRIPYRNTRQIFNAAFSLIENDAFAQKLLNADEVDKIRTIENFELREGPKPKICHFSSVAAEIKFIKDKIETLLDDGVSPKEIGVLHTQSFVINKYRRELQHGINIFESRVQTGLEYPYVFIPQVEKLFTRETDFSWSEDKSRQRMLLYMMMTRARSDLYLSYLHSWPKNLDLLKAYVTWCQESDL